VRLAPIEFLFAHLSPLTLPVGAYFEPTFAMISSETLFGTSS
jgi:hypothetical protein